MGSPKRVEIEIESGGSGSAVFNLSESQAARVRLRGVRATRAVMLSDGGASVHFDTLAGDTICVWLSATQAAQLASDLADGGAA